MEKRRIRSTEGRLAKRSPRFEELENRRLLAASVVHQPVVADQEIQATLPMHLLSSGWSDQPESVLQAQPGSSSPLFFGALQRDDSNQFLVSHRVGPADELDFVIQRARPFELSPALLDHSRLSTGDHMLLNLFDDARYPAVIRSKNADINGTTSLVVQLQEYEFAFGYISITGSDYLVSVDVPEKRAYYETRQHAQSGTMMLVQFDPQRPDVLDSSEPAAPIDFAPRAGEQSKTERDQGTEPSKLGGGSSGGSGSGLTQIDVMVVYTPAAAGWATNINNTIATAMSRSNTASNNSNLGISFNLVYSGQVNYTESGSSTDLGRLRGQFDGFMDEVHTLRNIHAADMVAILTLTNDTGGVAYLLSSRYGAEDLAFSLTRVQQASSTDTFVHELGHNMGAMHSKFQSVQAGPTWWQDWPENTWSAGWRFQGDNGTFYTTVMAYQGGQFYPDGINATRISVFSDPNITFQGQPVGHPTDGDNARTLRDVRNYIGQYRDADTLLYCSARGGFGDLGISNVTLGSINQNSGANSYHDFSFLSEDLEEGESLQLSVNATSASSLNQLRVWVDWNDDKDFFDPGELIFISGSSAVNPFVVPITAPQGTTAGPKRLRIRLHQPNLGGNLSPCGNSSTGEVQDFTLNVLDVPSTIVGSFFIHAGWTGTTGDGTDLQKSLLEESSEPQQLGLANLINSSQGITGLRLDVQDLPGNVSPSDFEFQWSPQGAFDEGLNPPAAWEVAPLPSQVSTIAGEPSQVVLLWPSGAIVNRWLRMTVLANTNTGLAESKVYYLGHLMGEITGPDASVFTVSFADISQIRLAIGQIVNASETADIDKNGIVNFADISAMRANVGWQLPAITVSASTSGGGGGHGAELNLGGRRQKGGSPEGSVRALAASPLDHYLDSEDARNLKHNRTLDQAAQDLTTIRHAPPRKTSPDFGTRWHLENHATFPPNRDDSSSSSAQDLALEQLMVDELNNKNCPFQSLTLLLNF